LPIILQHNVMQCSRHTRAHRDCLLRCDFYLFTYLITLHYLVKLKQYFDSNKRRQQTMTLLRRYLQDAVKIILGN